LQLPIKAQHQKLSQKPIKAQHQKLSQNLQDHYGYSRINGNFPCLEGFLGGAGEI
jgi:hypothetical protein